MPKLPFLDMHDQNIMTPSILHSFIFDTHTFLAESDVYDCMTVLSLYLGLLCVCMCLCACLKSFRACVAESSDAPVIASVIADITSDKLFRYHRTMQLLCNGQVQGVCVCVCVYVYVCICMCESGSSCVTAFGISTPPPVLPKFPSGCDRQFRRSQATSKFPQHVMAIIATAMGVQGPRCVSGCMHAYMRTCVRAGG